jgi:oxygen-independent coproporphyrinogen-3 oxidase
VVTFEAETGTDKHGRIDPRKNRPGQLLRGELSTIRRLAAGLPARCPRRSAASAETGHAAGALPPHSFLPQALQVLLFPRLYRQERPRRGRLPRRPHARGGAVQQDPGRPLHYIYFGGGTPSYLSAAQLRGLVQRLQVLLPWNGAAEVTFECEPGTLQQHKLETLKESGVTRLSLGIENFDDKILEIGGRAHHSAEIFRAYGWARDIGFDQINIDLIAGMVGETWDNWRVCVRKTVELAPDSVTIYQMELPYNTVISKELRVIGQDQPVESPVADWPTKRAWVNYAFEELQKAGYEVSSAYTMVRDRQRTRFVYRDSLWHGADMFGTGVASFGHVNGVHVQNVDSWERYVEMLQQGQLPLGRALPVSPRQLLIREMILQLKTGRLEPVYFREKFGVNILEEFREGFARLVEDGDAELANDRVTLTRQGLLHADRLLPVFFEPEYRGGRYT